jgi:hypothetical protein
MRIEFRRSVTAIAAAAVTAVGMLTVSQLTGQTPAQGQGVMLPGGGQIPRMGNRPNLNGIWQAVNTANWDLESQGGAPATIVAMGAIGATPPGLGVVEGGRIPYQPWALERKQDNYRNRATRDPEVKCHLPGIPRATYLPYPFQIFYSNSQGKERMAIVYQYSYARREINMGPPTEAPIDTWMGWPNARWEGDTLVIDVSAFIQPIVLAPGGPPSEHWFDRAGNFHSEGRRALHADGGQPSSVRSDDRGSEGFHAAVEDQHAALPPDGAERPAARVQVPRVHRGDALGPPAPSAEQLDKML